MVFDSVWNIWPFRGYNNTKTTRRHVKQSSRSIKGQNEPLIQFLGPWESKMVALQSILIWEKPGKSIVAIAAANIIYWYLAYSKLRFYFGVSLLGLVAFLHHQWVYSIWPEISVPKSQSDQEEWTPVNPSVLSAPEVSRYLKNTWTYVQTQQSHLAQLRRKQPGWFSVLMVVTFCLLWLLGHFVSGVVLLYTILMGVMCGPAFVIHFVPKSTFKRIEQITSVVFGKRSGTPESDLAEFLPEETNPDVQTALGIPLNSNEQSSLESNPGPSKGRQRSRSAKGKGRRGRGKSSTSSEVGSSFVSGLSESDFPAVEESSSLDCVEESDLALPAIASSAPERKVSEEGMTFVTTHFGDSSDDEDEFAFGLSFNQTRTTDSPLPRLEVVPDDPPPPSAANQVMTQLMGNMMAENTASLLSNLGQHLATAMGSASVSSSGGYAAPLVARSPSGSSIEEGFELISDDDLQ